ncbi:MAG: Rhodanese-related sulfurtransferase [Rariglobus sp.]|jgi:rhodanese-related sulfurtransferase|nr:Rhodanese-related sulfurtransferase [Rariglobus sp.]
MSQNPHPKNPRFLKLAAEAKERIREIDIEEYKKRAAATDAAPLLIDVRDAEEFTAGHPPGAIHLSRGTLEGKIEGIVPDLQTPIVCMCAGGNRSALAAESLQKMGYTKVSSLIGGFGAWTKASLPVVKP